jgi:hypothetical protein
MRTCPKCSLLSPDSAVMCDCGHPFDPAGAEAALSTGFRPRNEVDPPGPSKGAKFAVGLIGFVVGCLPLGIFAEYQAARGPRRQWAHSRIQLRDRHRGDSCRVATSEEEARVPLWREEDQIT